MIVFLDMDGVIANWTKAVADALRIDYDKLISEWRPGVYDTAEQLGITDGYMWSQIDKNPKFWSDIEPYDYAQKLVKELRKEHEVYICSSPSRHSFSLAGKNEWLVKYKFKFNRNFFFTPQKHLLAQPGRVLIDDLDKNIDKFNAHNGLGILFPQPWNFHHDISNVNKVDYVMDRLSKINNGKGII